MTARPTSTALPPGWILESLAIVHGGLVSVVVRGDIQRSPWPPVAAGVVLAAPMVPPTTLLLSSLTERSARRWFRLAAAAVLVGCAAVTYHIGGIGYVAAATTLLVSGWVVTSTHEERALCVLGVAHVIFGVLTIWTFGALFLLVGVGLLTGVGGYRLGRRAAGPGT